MRAWKLRRGHALIVLAAALTLALVQGLCAPETTEQSASEPAKPLPSEQGAASLAVAAAAASGAPPSYAGSAACRSCHSSQHQAWQRSHHAHAMAEPSEQTVRGDFAGASLPLHGQQASFSRAADGYQVLLTSDSGGATAHRVSYTFGYTPLQQYLVAGERGRWQVLPAAWDTERKRWFDANAGQVGADSPLHWQGLFGNYNVMCAPCHSTNLSKGYDAQADSYATRWAEISVGCEACHGPASQHLRWATTRDPAIANRGLLPPPRLGQRAAERHAQARRRLGAAPASAPVDEISLCGPCHSRRQAISQQATFGEPYLEHYLPELLREGLYFADGQIDDEVFVLGSFLQSKMHRNGVVCSNCHNPHSGELVVKERKLCVRCHDESRYANDRHHLHAPGSQGARCVSCHMPERTYMQVDPRRDHSFVIPRPDVSAALGTPDPCTNCHRDRTAQWAADALSRLHGPRDPADHPGSLLHAGRSGSPQALAGLLKLAADPERSAILRATALELLGRYPTERTRDQLHASLRDSAPLVRFAASEGAAQWPAAERLSALAPLLDDPLRAVRIQAARVLAEIHPERLLREPQATSYRRALDEYRDAQRANLDHPGGRTNLAVLHAIEGDLRAAEQQYRAALKLAPGYTPAAVNLAALLEQQDRPREAIVLLEQALSHVADSGELHYALGLLLARQRRYPEAAEHLAIARQRLPEHPRVRHNHEQVLKQLAADAR